jgi:hypothetical protein
MFTAPVFLGPAFLVFALAIIEKVLNIFGGHIPLLSVFPSQLLDWAVVLIMFEIALTLRQVYERMLAKSDAE